MKRKDVLGMPVFSEQGAECFGMIKEIILSKEEYRIELFIINGEEQDLNYILAFNKATLLENSILVSGKSDLIRMGSFYDYSDKKMHESLFCGKDVVNEEGEQIGTIIDYSFDNDEGLLDEISYIISKIGKVLFLKSENIINNTNDSIMIKENYFKINENDVEAYSVDKIQNIEKEILDIIFEFKEEMKEERKKLVYFYETVEKKIQSEVDSFLTDFKENKNNNLDINLKQIESKILQNVVKNYEKVMEGLSDKNFLFSEEAKNEENSFLKQNKSEKNSFLKQNKSEENIFDKNNKNEQNNNKKDSTFTNFDNQKNNSVNNFIEEKISLENDFEEENFYTGEKTEEDNIFLMEDFEEEKLIGNFNFSEEKSEITNFEKTNIKNFKSLDLDEDMLTTLDKLDISDVLESVNAIDYSKNGDNKFKRNDDNKKNDEKENINNFKEDENEISIIENSDVKNLEEEILEESVGIEKLHQLQSKRSDIIKNILSLG